MEVEGLKSSLGYGKPPWIFKGRALYQLHLVKAETARALIPKDFRLVEAFGYTLGGFFLASYDESPAGRFDELVVIAGTLWNPPTSCAWAGKVLVNSELACEHGRKEVGLPSQVANFSKCVLYPTPVDEDYIPLTRITPVQKQARNKAERFLSLLGMGGSGLTNQMDIQVSEMNNPHTTKDVCNINLTSFLPTSKVDNRWKGPAIRMSLPSFSGLTEYNQNLLKYSCLIDCRIRAVSSMKVSKLPHATNKKAAAAEEEERCNRCLSVMLSKPLLALEFSCLKMQVDAPIIVN